MRTNGTQNDLNVVEPPVGAPLTVAANRIAPVAELGSAMMTLIDPLVGEEAAYNEWYDRDHFHAGGVTNPHTLAGQRWVATRELKLRRYLGPDNSVSEDRMQGSYLHLYWVQAGHYAEWDLWNRAGYAACAAAGRMSGNRRTPIYMRVPQLIVAQERDQHGVPPYLALDHRFPGLVVTATRANPGVTADEFQDWWRVSGGRPLLQRDSPIAMCLTFVPEPLVIPSLGLVGDPETGQRLIHFWFCDEPATDIWDDYFADEDKRLAVAGAGQLEWSSPFLPTVPGTSRYADQLW